MTPKLIKNWLIIAAALGLSLVTAELVMFKAQSSGWQQLFPESNDASPLALTICQVQGTGFSSPYTSTIVKLQGVVFADLDEKSYGFYFQDEGCDQNPNTSDGLFVYLGGNNQTVNSGDLVEVTGVVNEYYGKTEIIASPLSVTVISTGNPLPAPVELAPPFNNNQAAYYFETHEDMYVRISEAMTVGPTNSNGESWVVPANLGIQRVFYDDPQGTGEALCVDDRGLYKIDPQVRVGDRVNELLGGLDYSVGLYRLQLVAQPTVIPLATMTEDYRGMNEQSLAVVTLATFNLANMFDTVDDSGKEDTVLSPTEYNRRLSKRALAIHEGLNEPDILALQEVENDQVLQDLINRDEIQADYRFVWTDTPDLRGLDNALLYRTERVVLIGYQSRQGCTQLVDGLGPDGNGDVNNPVNAVTCDTDGDEVLDGNRLFSRPPLVARMLVGPHAAARIASPSGDWLEVYVIVNHWKSKVEDTPTVKYTFPRRVAEAQFVASLVQEIGNASPQASVIVAGDLNDYPDSLAVTTLVNGGLEDLSHRIEKSYRYSYNYQGISQVMDYILARMTLTLPVVSIQNAPINSDFPVVFQGDSGSIHRSSDHDPLLATFGHFNYFKYFPLISASAIEK